jgi:ribosome-binding protein aMBF1 (putative translation factor)
MKKKGHLDLRAGWRTECEEKASEHIAARIKAAREQAALSQRQLSQVMGL